VAENVIAKGFLPREFVNFEVNWFYDRLGIEVCPQSVFINDVTSDAINKESYFANESVEVITDHISALYAAKIIAYTKQANALVIDLERITEQKALFIHTSAPGVTAREGPGQLCERRYVQSLLSLVSFPTDHVSTQN
jgi:glutamate dehydrogenase